MTARCHDIVHHVRLHEDRDYVAAIQSLGCLAIKMRRGSITTDVLVRKARLEVNLGNYRQALRTTQHALTMDPESVEANLLAARTCLYLGLTAAGVAEASPGTPGDRPEKVWLELYRARDTLERFASHLDAQASMLLAFLRHILQGEPCEQQLIKRLRRHFSTP